MKIRTCPDFKFLFEKKKFGLVQIFIYQLNISNLDLSRFEFRTRPNFFFQLKIWNLDMSRYQFRTSDSHVIGLGVQAALSLCSKIMSLCRKIWSLCNMFGNFCSTDTIRVMVPSPKIQNDWNGITMHKYLAKKLHNTEPDKQLVSVIIMLVCLSKNTQHNRFFLF